MLPWLPTIVEPVVGDVYRRYSDYVGKDDLRQEAAVWWYGPGQKFVGKYLTDDENHVRLRRSLWRYIAGHAEAERAHVVGYSVADQVRYSPSQILGMLRVALDTEALPEVTHTEGPKPQGNKAEGGDILASLVDVRRAIDSLSYEDQAFLILADDLGENWDLVATHTGTLPDSCRRRHARIAERMARFLNRDTEIA
jgi:DNA-directed RNA polymerase specialized sigma24 family protein